MLLNLKTEIARRKLSQAKIAAFLGISEKTMSKKVNEVSEFTRSEMYKIHENFFANVAFKYLFYSSEDEGSHHITEQERR